jgi:iron complex outermembrane receptor protein
VSPGKLNYQNFWAFDSKLRVELSDQLKITFAADYARKHDNDGNAHKNNQPDLAYDTYLVYAGPFVGGISNLLPRSAFDKPGKHKTYGAIKDLSYITDYGGSARIELRLGGLDLTSITALRWNESRFRGDIGATVVPMAGFFTHFKRRSLYQEIRAVSTGSGPLRYLGGVTFYKDHVDTSIGGLLLGFTLPGLTTSTSRTRAWSGYGQLSYDLSDRLTLTGSLRYVWEKKAVAFPSESVATSSHAFIPAATISYKVSGGTAYFRYARGFKTGGVNPLVTPTQFGIGNPGSIFKPETVDAFEVGYRAQLFDRKVQFTTAVFYNKYKNLQAVGVGTIDHPEIAEAILNAGRSRTYGAEASVTWRVLPALTLNANLGYLNAKLNRFFFPGNNVVAAFDYSGNRNAMAPRWQGGFGANLDTPINDRLRLVFNGLASYTSSYFYTESGNPYAAQRGYWLVNTRVGVVTANERIGVYLFANNLFDKAYTVFGSESAAGGYTTDGSPRIIGGTVELKF